MIWSEYLILFVMNNAIVWESHGYFSLLWYRYTIIAVDFIIKTPIMSGFVVSTQLYFIYKSVYSMTENWTVFVGEFLEITFECHF